jgi:diguanylate cyclase (GGDEF)-like protein
MTVMPPETAPDVAHAGQPIKNRILIALAIASVLPILILAFVVLVLLVPTLAPAETLKYAGLQLLLVFTVIAMLTGGYVIWHIGQIMAQIASAARDAGALGGEGRRDDPDAVLTAVKKMRTTMAQQDSEINTLNTRLDAAYKELDTVNAKLKETSFKDDVTGLYNRRFFSLRLEEELSRYRRFNHPVSVVLLDLDGFKAVNDEFGHVVGDETLREVAQILMKHSRGINVVSRYGGDEFAVLLVETSKAGARLYADRIREVVAKYPFSHGKVITSSFGVASLPDDEAGTAEDLFRAADEALYTAKRAGKNQVAATPSPQRVP